MKCRKCGDKLTEEDLIATTATDKICQCPKCKSWTFGDEFAGSITRIENIGEQGGSLNETC